MLESGIDPRLDWQPRHDPRSLNYLVRDTLTVTETYYPKFWDMGAVLNQGREGACVGFGWTGELLASPRPHLVSEQRGNEYARQYYYRCKEIDEWEGVDYEGTSVLAGAKVARELGYIPEYRWAVSIDDVRDSVITKGPVVIGIPWLSGMYDTRPSGLVDVSGDTVGGHCILLTGYHPSMRIPGEDWHARFEVFRWRNSWGTSYGKSGTGLIRMEDLRDLLARWGEACVPVGRKLVRF